jgi:hypothetical protein
MAFIIVGHLGMPIYELLDFAGTKREDLARNSQFLLHAALDSVDLSAASASATSTYLKVVDRHNEQLVSAYITPGGARFLVLHDARNEVRLAVCALGSSAAGLPLPHPRLPSPPSHTHTHTHTHTPLQEGIRAFCNEVHEMYVKILLNPFYTPGSRIDSTDFDQRVQQIARRYVGYKG